MRSTILLQCLLLVWSIPAWASALDATSNSNTATASDSATLSSAASTSAIDSSAASTTDSSSPSSAAPSSTSTDSTAASSTTSSFTSSITSSLTTSTISTTTSSSSPTTTSTTTSTTASSTASATSTSSSAPFTWDAGEIAATTVLLGFLSIGALSIIIWWVRKARKNRRALAAERGSLQSKPDAAGMAERGLHPESHPMIPFGTMPERDSHPSSRKSIYQHQSTAYTGGLEQYPERHPTLSSTHSTVGHSPYSIVSPLERSQDSPSPVMSQWRQQRPSSNRGRGLHREFSFQGQDQAFIPAALTPGGRSRSFAS